MPRYSTKQKTLKKTPIIAGLVALLILAGGGTWLWQRQHRTTQPSPTTQGSKLDLSPATPAEKQDSEQHKADIVKQDENTKTPPTDSGKRTVAPTIVEAKQYDQQVEVRSSVSGVVEDGGTCTATFTRDSTSFTKTSSGNANASNTQCDTFVVPRSSFVSAGTWSVTVQYSSANSGGTSTAKTFEVR